MGIFDIIGPVMIGPSSSHTAGAARIGRMTLEILGEEIAEAEVTLYGSFAKTGKGHGTDKALAAGLLGFPPSSDKIRSALELARKIGVAIRFSFSDEDMGHPNVASIRATGKSGRTVNVTGRSLGGGRILITCVDGYPVEISGEEYTLIAHHQDVPGVIAQVCLVLAGHHLNISNMKVFRKGKGDDAVMIIHTDEKIPAEVLGELRACNRHISQIMALDII